MQTTMYLAGKQQGQSLVAVAAGHKNGLLFLCDSTSERQFLVDTGAEVSVLPATGLDTHTKQAGPPLLAANGSSIRTYGTRRLSLHFAFDTYHWNFIIANVTRPLLGTDFVHSNSLLVDLKGKRLVDAATFHSAPLRPTTAPAPRLDAISTSTNQHDMLLAEFPDITTPNFVQSPTKHGVEHFITTRSPPVHARARRLPLEKLAAAKSEFNRMEAMGITYVGHPVPGHHPYTWCRKLLGASVLVETTDNSMMPQFLTDIQYPTYRISPPTSLAGRYSPRLISSEATTRFRWLLKTSPKQQSLLLLGSLNSSGCHSV